jgi:hypothetical protein
MGGGHQIPSGGGDTRSLPPGIAALILGLEDIIKRPVLFVNARIVLAGKFRYRENEVKPVTA